MSKTLVLAITGASGAPYAVRLLDVLISAGCHVYLTISPAAAAVFKQELGLEIDLRDFRLESLFRLTPQVSNFVRRTHPVTDESGTRVGPSAADDSALRSQPRREVAPSPGALAYCHYQDLMSPIASGSSLTDGMVICPCSGSTLGAIAHAMGANLIHRAAEVHLKERRKLILVTRETPLSLPQIENMRAATLAGAVVMPATPGFYHDVHSVADLVDFVVARICDQLGVAHSLMRRWGDDRPKNDVAPSPPRSSARTSAAR